MVHRHYLSAIAIFVSFAFSLSSSGEAFDEVYHAKASLLTLRMSHMPLGRFDTVVIDPFEFQAQKKDQNVQVVPQSLNIETRTLKSLISLRDEHIYKILEAEKFPKISLENIKVDLNKSSFTANLKVRSLSRPVSGDFTVDYKKNMFQIMFEDKLTKFDIQPPTYLNVGVKDSFRVVVEGTFKQEVVLPEG